MSSAVSTLVMLPPTVDQGADIVPALGELLGGEFVQIGADHAALDCIPLLFQLKNQIIEFGEVLLPGAAASLPLGLEPLCQQREPGPRRRAALTAQQSHETEQRVRHKAAAGVGRLHRGITVFPLHHRDLPAECKAVLTQPASQIALAARGEQYQVVPRRAEPECTGEDGGNRLPSHPGDHDLLRLLWSEHREPIPEPAINPVLEAAFPHQRTGPAERPGTKIGRHHMRAAAALDQINSELAVITADIRRTVALPHQGCGGPQPCAGIFRPDHFAAMAAFSFSTSASASVP